MLCIRHATQRDAAAISSLVCGLAGSLLVDPNGDEAKNFHSAMAPDAVQRYMEMGDRFYVVAELDGTVQGMIMVRHNNYIGQFFVATTQQGKGIGAALWHFGLAHSKLLGGTGEFTVNAGLPAVPVYRRFGFLVSGPVQAQHGFRFIPMHKGAKVADARESSACANHVHPAAQHFELRRKIDGLTYSFARVRGVDGQVAYRRADKELFIRYEADLGWVARDPETNELTGRPWEDELRHQADHPPAGEWVSKKGSKSYVYDLVYLPVA